MISALESIDFALLHDVTGGCGKKHGCCSAPVQQCQVVMPPMPMPAPLPPAPTPAPESGGPTVSTSVSINGQPAA
ncbi:MAG TPA: hypothetical protein VFK02_30890 [Kofleriaceae bacterium]|nr:hypothetical protein [Kofleriaceae bacterium]